MIIQTSKDKSFLINFELVQIEITGKCNMGCEHCRASKEKRHHLSLGYIKKSIDFAIKEGTKDLRLTLSGGEPFLHPKIIKILKYANDKKIKNVAITTNGSIYSDEILEKIKLLKFKNIFIQISLDSTNEEEHDKFRKFPGSFKKIKKLIKILNKKKISFSIKCTLSPITLNKMEGLVNFAINHHAKRIGIGSVISAGRSLENNHLIFTPILKKRFIDNVSRLKNKYKKRIEIVTEDPLKVCSKIDAWSKSNINEDDLFFGGCAAGIGMCDIGSDGSIRPCSLFPIEIVNIKYGSLNYISNKYENSKIIKDLISRNFTGRCGKCKIKNKCGGCRAISYNLNGDYMGEDTTCWI